MAGTPSMAPIFKQFLTVQFGYSIVCYQKHFLRENIFKSRTRGNLVHIRASLLMLVLLTSSCAINQSVEPSEVTDNSEVCIIEDPSVREGFLEELKKVLDEKDINYKVVDKQTALACEWTVTYLARWTWDMALYMSYAEIKVYRNGQLDGQAVYDATKGSFNLNKFIDAEPKIRELVEELMQE